MTPALSACRPRATAGHLVLALAASLALAGTSHPQELTLAERSRAAGDAPDTAPPRANLSAEVTPRAVHAAMRTVAEWQQRRSAPYSSRDWTFAALYAGFMAASAELADPKYETAMLDMGRQVHWQPGPRPLHADDIAVGQVYLDLYRKHKDPEMLQPIRERIAQQMNAPAGPKPIWWWCDALFMAPPVLTRLYRATGDASYLAYLDRQWWITSDLLYDPLEHLYTRDARYLDRREANGSKVFWLRGNGWVMGGLARVLDDLPESHPTRPRYLAQFREMAARLAGLQQKDGLWRPGLLDPDAYALPEVSGSAFVTYALAWGVNRGVLERSAYGQIAARAWRGLLAHIYSDGRLGCIQPIGEAPGKYAATASYVYGVGAFLLAGSEVAHLEISRLRRFR